MVQQMMVCFYKVLMKANAFLMHGETMNGFQMRFQFPQIKQQPGSTLMRSVTVHGLIARQLERVHHLDWCFSMVQ